MRGACTLPVERSGMASLSEGHWSRDLRKRGNEPRGHWEGDGAKGIAGRGNAHTLTGGHAGACKEPQAGRRGWGGASKGERGWVSGPRRSQGPWRTLSETRSPRKFW